MGSKFKALGRWRGNSTTLYVMTPSVRQYCQVAYFVAQMK